MRVDTEITVRHPYVGEVPEALVEGFGWWKIDPEWQWVMVERGKVVAQLLTANTHGLLFLLRLTALPEAPKGAMLRLLRTAMKEAKSAGLLGYITWLGDDTEAQVKLMRIVQRHNGYLLPRSGVWVGGRLEER